MRVRKPKPPEPDRRPWLVRDTLGETADVLTWHKANAENLARNLLPGAAAKGRYKIINRTKEAT